MRSSKGTSDSRNFVLPMINLIKRRKPVFQAYINLHRAYFFLAVYRFYFLYFIYNKLHINAEYFWRSKMAAVKVTKDSFQEEVLNSKVPVLVDFFADWCGPCRMVSPLIDELADEHSEYKFCKVNVDEQQELASQFGIMSIPSLLVFKDGKVAKQSAGALPKEHILEMVKTA